MASPHVAALLRERAGYVHRNLPARVAAVDEELHVHGHDPETTDQSAGDGQVEQATRQAPEQPGGARPASVTRGRRPRRNS